jgi:hypothetical protein
LLLLLYFVGDSSVSTWGVLETFVRNEKYINCVWNWVPTSRKIHNSTIQRG